MQRILLIRAGALYVPIATATLLWMVRRPGKSARAGLLLAWVWNLVTLLPVNLVAIHLGWWSFHVEGGLLLDFPVDLYLGWIVLWGVVPLLAFPSLPFSDMMFVFLGLDVISMPLLYPVLHLGKMWLAGEVLAIVVCFLPAQMLGRWTRESTNLGARASLQMLAFSGLTLGVLPAIILAATGGRWTGFLARPAWLNGLILQVLAVPAVLGLSAVQEFAQRGRGTPLPYDPPQRLVSSGPYAYIANPMQLSAAVLLVGWGWSLGSLWVAAAGIMAHIYGLGLAAWDESGDVEERFGAGWLSYRKQVRNWIPRWRPWHSPLNESAIVPRLYVSETCGACSQLKRWFERRGATGLLIVAAELHPRRDLTRITYDPGDGGPEERGVAGLARGLEHINFAYAFAGWVMRLPVLVLLLQLLADASGAGPRCIPPEVEGPVVSADH